MKIDAGVPNIKKLEDGVLIERLKNVVIKDQYSPNQLTEPHKHNYFTCLFIERGTIELLVDHQRITVGKNTLHIVFPGQIHQFLNASPLTAYHLSFDSLLITEQVRNVLEQSLTEQLIIKLTESESEWFRSLMILMTDSRHERRGIDINIHTFQSLVTTFVIQACSIYQTREQSTTSGYSSHQVYITKKFRQLVRLKFRELKRPSEYAGIMNLSVSYLNDTVRKVTGFCLSHFIQREIILEAQRLLYYSGRSVKEIGISLGYEDYKYFNRLFSKVAGIPPGEFRNRSSISK